MKSSKYNTLVKDEGGGRIHNTVYEKARHVYNYYRELYKAGIKFNGHEIFKKRKMNVSQFIEEWGAKEIDFQYEMMVKERERNKDEFYSLS